MISTHRPYIAHEGWIFILFALVCAWGMHMSVGGIYAIPVWLLTILLVYVFRDPDRKIPPIALAVVSPVDGRIKAIENTVDPYLERNATAIRMNMKLTGSFVVRSPIEGKVMNQWLGTVNPARQENGTNSPEHVSNDKYRHYHAMWAQTDEGDDVVLVLVKKMFGFRPRYYVHAGERVGQGQRCGFVSFGCEALLLVPEVSRRECIPGNSVTAGSDVIATLIHK
jgi:phosphatidylserine decarboxylase